MELLMTMAINTTLLIEKPIYGGSAHHSSIAEGNLLLNLEFHKKVSSPSSFHSSIWPHDKTSKATDLVLSHLLRRIWTLSHFCALSPFFTSPCTSGNDRYMSLILFWPLSQVDRTISVMQESTDHHSNYSSRMSRSNKNNSCCSTVSKFSVAVQFENLAESFGWKETKLVNAYYLQAWLTLLVNKHFLRYEQSYSRRHASF